MFDWVGLDWVGGDESVERGDPPREGPGGGPRGDCEPRPLRPLRGPPLRGPPPSWEKSAALIVVWAKESLMADITVGSFRDGQILPMASFMLSQLPMSVMTELILFVITGLLKNELMTVPISPNGLGPMAGMRGPAGAGPAAGAGVGVGAAVGEETDETDAWFGRIWNGICDGF